MLNKVVGLRRLDYENKAGRAVKGYSINCLFEERNVEGYSVSSYFFSDDLINESLSTLSSVKDLVGCQVNISFNRFGRPEEIRIVENDN